MVLPASLASQLGASLSPSGSTPDQPPADGVGEAAGEAAGDGPSVWAPTTRVGDLDEAPVSSLTQRWPLQPSGV